MRSPPKLSCDCQDFNPSDPAALRSVIVTDYTLPHCTYDSTQSEHSQKPCISTNSKGEIGTSTEDSCSDNTKFRFCQTINQRGISSGFVKALYETVLLTKVLAKWVNVQVPLTLCGTIYTLLYKGQRINWVLAISWLCQFIHNQLHVLLCLLQGHSHQHAWLP